MEQCIRHQWALARIAELRRWGTAFESLPCISGLHAGNTCRFTMPMSQHIFKKVE